MKTVGRVKSEKIWDRFWNEMQDEFFKLEVLQYYDEDYSSSLQEWLKGNKKKSLDLALKEFPPWAEGKEFVKKIRVHIVKKPLTPYLRWEIELYKINNIPLVGEEVFLLDAIHTKDLEIPKGDILIFDKKKVIANSYDNRGKLTSAKIYEGDKEIKPFLKLRGKILKLPLEKVK